jgi:ubiquinone/menaquinone biosynthesis C-methylase UbiE
MSDRVTKTVIPPLGPEVYKRWRDSEVGAITEKLEYELILRLVGDVSGARVLDIGCGDGLLAVLLGNRGANVVALDASEAMLAAAGERATQEQLDIELSVGRAESLPFPNESFDVVTAITILCFVAEAEQTFREIGRVLRPGGRLIIGELGKWSTWAAGRRIRSWFGSPLWRCGHFRTARELQRLSRAGGLIPDRVRGAVYYPRSRYGARWLSRYDAWFARRSTLGAAFLAVSAVKPGCD